MRTPSRAAPGRAGQPAGAEAPANSAGERAGRAASLVAARRAGLKLAAAALVALQLAGCAGVPDVPGRRSVVYELAGDSVSVDVYGPEGAPLGAVIVAHGFAGSRVHFTNLARELSSDGWQVAVPEISSRGDPALGARVIVDLWVHLRHSEASAAAPAVPDRLVLIGFSLGATASLMAAAEILSTVACIGLDGVDRRRAGARAAPDVHAPALLLHGPPGACNLRRNASTWTERLPALREERLIPGASHCDFTDSSDLLCAQICGAPDEARQRQVRDLVRRFVAQFAR